MLYSQFASGRHAAPRWLFKQKHLISSYNLRECEITNAARLLKHMFGS